MSVRLPHLEITPFVALAPPRIELQLNNEVADAFWVSLRQLKQEGMSSKFTLKLDEGERSWPAFASYPQQLPFMFTKASAF